MKTQSNKLQIPEPFFKNVEIYSPTDELLGTIFTETQFYEIRCQIKECNLGAGYYFKCGGNRITMDKYGRLNRNEEKHAPFKYDEYLERLIG